MAYDAANQEMVLFGGQTEAGVRLDDTWTWNGEDWTEENPAHSPSARHSARMAFDPSTGQLILVGGQSVDGILGETWTWDGSDWTELSPATPAPAVALPTVAHDPASESVLLFGGSADGTPQNWTWSWNGSTWTQLSPPTSPPARWGASMAFDRDGGEMILFSGGGQNSLLNDTWTWNGTDWNQEFPANSPMGIGAGSMAFSPAAGTPIQLGGGLADPGARISTWSWAGSDWSQLDPAASPPARFSAAMQSDPDSGTVVLFGGLTMDGPVLGDTWTYGIPEPEPEVPEPEVPEPEAPVCTEVEGSMNLRTFRLVPPLGHGPTVPGLRVLTRAAGNVDARISPRIFYRTGKKRRAIALKSTTVRIKGQRKLRFALPKRARREIRRSVESLYRSWVTLRLATKLKAPGDDAGCFRDAGARTLKVRVTNVAERVALRGR